MRIGIELRQIVLGSTGGIAQLLKGVLEALFAGYPDHEFILFCTDLNQDLVKGGYDHVETLVLPGATFFSEVDRIMAEKNIELLFRSYPMEDNLRFPLNKQVFLIPDIQHEFFPEFFAPEILETRRRAFNHALAGAGAIGTLTGYTRDTIYAHEWTRCQDIFLISPALPAEHRQASVSSLRSDEEALVPGEDFFLYPANLWPHKNHRLILQAFELFLNSHSCPMTLVLTGHPAGWPELQADFPNLPVQHLGFVRPQLLRRLFERAKALTFFSLYEGFGIPLLEAFDAGTPVICSNITSLPEVGGNATLACDPTNISAMSRLMLQIIQDDPLRNELVTRGKKRLQAYTWEQSAQNLFEACQRVARAAGSKTLSGVSLVAGDYNPLVTIVTPSYNQGRFLGRTIESVLNQTYPHIEYIVMDGGSTDESLEVLQSYGDRFSWISEPDKGQADAINNGFARSNGEIRAYLNSDDLLYPEAVETVVNFFRQQPQYDLVYGRAYYIDEEDTITGMYNTADYSFARLMHDNCVCQPAAFWQTRIAKKLGPFNDRLNYVMDYDYWLRIGRGGGAIAHIPDILAASRLYPETKTLSARSEIYNEIFKICQEHGGYVDLNYFYGLWHHRMHEKDTGWPVYLGYFSTHAYQFLARFHYRWYNRHRYSLKGFLFSSGSRVKGWLAVHSHYRVFRMLLRTTEGVARQLKRE